MSDDPEIGGYIFDYSDEDEYYLDIIEFLTLEDIDYLRDKTLEISKQTESHFRRIIDPNTGSPIKTTAKVNLSLYGRTGSDVDLGSGEFITYGLWPIKDSWISSDDSAKAKAFTAFSYSSDENAFTTRSLKRFFPDKTENNSFTMEPGGLPLYKNGKLIGGIGISGDLPDINEQIALAVSNDYSPPEYIKIDNIESNISLSIDTESKIKSSLNNPQIAYFSKAKKLNSDSEKKFIISIKSQSNKISNTREYFFIKKYEDGKEMRFCTHIFTKETIDSIKKKSNLLICPTCKVLKK